MSENKSLIEFGELSKPATVLIEKVSSAVGVLYEPRRIRKRAEAEAEAEKIKALAQVEITEIQQRGIERLVHQEGRKQQNIEKITYSAAQQVTPDGKTDDLEEDWVAHFFDKCENISDEQMQSLWSKLLAGEATTPGTYSKRTIDFVASMDKSDAELFTKFCQFTWVVGQPTPVIFEENNDIYSSKGINFTALQHLDAIGLIKFNSMGYKRQGFGKQAVIFYFGRPLVLEFEADEGNELQFGKALFTQAGLQLVGLCGAVRNEGFYHYAVEKFSKNNVIVHTPIQFKGGATI